MKNINNRMSTRSFVTGFISGALLSALVYHYMSGSNINSRNTSPTYLSGQNAGYNDIDRDDNTTAVQLYEKVRILCWIMTSPQTLQTRAKFVRDSWAKRCNIRLFMSSVEDKDFPTVGLPVKEGRDQLYEKTKEAYKYIWKYYRDKADWFLKADDDTFLVVENLRFLVKDHDPGKPIYFGKRRLPHVKDGFMGGGSGYVLSKEATRRFIVGLRTKCAKGSGLEDIELGKCMRLMGVEPGDSRDSQHRERFFPISAAEALVPGHIKDEARYKKHSYYESCVGLEECASPFPISFHRAYGPDMNVFDYLIKSKVYGVGNYYKRYQKLPYE